MTIKFNEITWYSKLAAVIFFLGVFPTLTFYIGMRYEEATTDSTIVPPTTVLQTYAVSKTMIEVKDAGVAFAYPTECKPTLDRQGKVLYGAVASYELNCQFLGQTSNDMRYNGSVSFFTPESIRVYNNYLHSGECQKNDDCSRWRFLEADDYLPAKNFISGIGLSQSNFPNDSLITVGGRKYLVTDTNLPGGWTSIVTFEGDTMVEFITSSVWRVENPKSFFKDFMFKQI